MKDSGVKVVRVDHTAPADLKKPEDSTKKTGKKYKSSHRKSQPKHGILKGGKTARNRFEGVKDPAKSPPSKKLRILTDKGLTLRHRKVMDDAAKVPIAKIRHTLRKHGLPIKESTPEKLARKIYEDAQEAGMLSTA
jgi:hypothetical protein